MTNKCQCPECQRLAISSFDENGEISEQPGFCYEHTENKDKALADIIKYIDSHNKIIGLLAGYVPFKDLDFKEKRFYGCDFQHSSFTNIFAENIRFRMCISDFSTFTDCNFINSNIQFSSFSGSKLVHMIFTGSDLIHNNYNGITAYQSSFDDSNLYNSSFIKAILLNTSMKNCNLKKTIFYESVRNNVSFKLSNTREALVDRNTKGIAGLIETGDSLL